MVDRHIKSLETTFLNAGASDKVAPHVAGARAQLPQGFDDTVDLGLDGSDIDSDANLPLTTVPTMNLTVMVEVEIKVETIPLT